MRLKSGYKVEVMNTSEVPISWHTAEVLRGDHYLVRLLGCSEEFSIHRSQMRSRQYWQDGKWVLLPKGSGNFKALKSHKLSSYTCHKKLNFQSPSSDHWANVRGGKECFAPEDITRLQDSHVVSSRSLKRESPYYSSTVESYPGNSQKLRALETNCKRQRVVAPSQSLEKGHWWMHDASLSSVIQK